MFRLLEETGFLRVKSAVVPNFRFRKPATQNSAEAYGVKGIHINKAKDARKKLNEAINYKGPVVVHAEVIKEDNVFPMVPAGKSAYHMIIEPPTEQLEKPTGST